MYKVIIIDDEVNNMSALREKLLKHYPTLEVIASCENAMQGLEAIESLQPDIVFLDIEMPVMNGFTMLQQVRNRDFELIFTTAYDHYAIKAIRYSAIDYLLKPIEIDELKTAVDNAIRNRQGKKANLQVDMLLEQVKNSHYRKIAIPTHDGIRFQSLDGIVYLEANLNYTYIVLTDNTRLLVSRNLKEFEELLPAVEFLRIHHSHIINRKYVDRYIRGEGGQVVMQNGTVLDVSKRKKGDFLKMMGL
jgi:two-component system LytT family response regulator